MSGLIGVNYKKKNKMSYFLMNKTNCFLTLAFLALCFSGFSQGIAINDDGATPDETAILDVQSTTKGFLPPRMDESERDAIASPAVGLTIYNTDSKCLEWWNGTEWFTRCQSGGAYINCDGSPMEIVEVTSLATGRVWMDRNLGASQVATSKDDADAFGDLFQWGRGADGHQCRDSPTLPYDNRSEIDQPGHGDFILTPSSPSDSVDWRVPGNNDLWQGLTGINNPCPEGFRVPTRIELEDEFDAWRAAGSVSAGSAPGDAEDAFASELKIPAVGGRARATGGISSGIGAFAASRYWTSTIGSSITQSIAMTLQDGTAGFSNFPGFPRGNGAAVRCIKD